MTRVQPHTDIPTYRVNIFDVDVVGDVVVAVDGMDGTGRDGRDRTGRDGTDGTGRDGRRLIFWKFKGHQNYDLCLYVLFNISPNQNKLSNMLQAAFDHEE